MSGSGGGRSDDYFGGGGSGGGGGPGGPADPCSVPRRGPINSPKAAVLAGSKVGDVLQVDVDKSGRSPVLVVKRGGVEAGSLTFNGYLTVISCIDKGIVYEATILVISGAVYEVLVAPV